MSNDGTARVKVVVIEPMTVAAKEQLDDTTSCSASPRFARKAEGRKGQCFHFKSRGYFIQVPTLGCGS